MEVTLGVGTLYSKPHEVCRRCNRPIVNPDRVNAKFHIACRPVTTTERSILYYRWRSRSEPQRYAAKRLQEIEREVDDPFAEIRTCSSCKHEFVARDKRQKVCSLWCFAPAGKFRRQAVGSVGI